MCNKISQFSTNQKSILTAAHKHTRACTFTHSHLPPHTHTLIDKDKEIVDPYVLLVGVYIDGVSTVEIVG